MRSRQRTHFTDYQTRILEERFTNCHYPNSDMKKELAAELGLLENRITVSFFLTFFWLTICVFRFGFKIAEQKSVGT